MPKWIALIVILPVLWAGYWFFGSWGLKSELSDWLTERQADGWQAEYTDLGVRGFPNRFDATITDVLLTDPKSGISWSAPFFQMLSLSYKPHHWIAVWPENHSLSTPYQKILITSQDTKASMVFAPENLLPLQRGTLIAQNAKLSSDLVWDIEVGKLSASLKKLDAPNSYGAIVEIDTVTPSKSLRDWLNEKQNLPAQIENVTIDLTTELSAPIDRRTIDIARPQIVTLAISQAKATWGDLSLRAAGEVTVNSIGQLDGQLQVSARNWREMLKLAVLSGAISGEVAAAAEFGLGLIARLNGSEKSLDAPLIFKDGRMSLGPIPIGQAPTLIIR